MSLGALTRVLCRAALTEQANYMRFSEMLEQTINEGAAVAAVEAGWKLHFHLVRPAS